MRDAEQEPFERGATYRARVPFEAFRDRFEGSERLVYFRHAVSSYDSMEGWFFYVEGDPTRVLAWDIALGKRPSETPFEKVAEVAPIVRAAEAEDVAEVERLAQGRSIDDPFVRVALESAIDSGRPRAAAAIVATAPLSEKVRNRALSDAALGGQLLIVRALLDVGVAAAASAIWSAVWSGSAEILELLIAHGADPRGAERPIASLIEFAERQGQARIVQILRRFH